MPRCAFVVLIGAIALAACDQHAAPPPAADPASSRVAASVPCSPSPGELARFAQAEAAQIVQGTFALTVVATQGGGPDTLVRGQLTLQPTDSAHRHPPNPAITFLSHGATDVDLTRLGPVSLAYSPAASDADRPGIQVSHDGEHLSMIAGNAFGRVITTDAGVLFWIVAGDEAGFRGRWEDGGRRTPLPGGYFCAVRR